MDQAERMLKEVIRWKESGLTQKVFCEQLGIKVGTFAYWVAKSREEKEQGFIPLTAKAGYSGAEIEVLYPNGVRVKVSSGDMKMLWQLIRHY